MRVAFIMRGVPGSGKSTLAKKLAENWSRRIHSTDNFFYVDGEYHFDPSRLREYHDRNFDAFCRSLNDGIPVVICDNTNVRRWHFERYVGAANRAGYLVAIVAMQHPEARVAAQHTTHNVPLGDIQRMIDEWEDRLPSTREADWLLGRAAFLLKILFNHIVRLLFAILPI